MARARCSSPPPARSTSPPTGRPRCAVRLSVRFRVTLYSIVAVLFVTGVAWIALDRAVWPETSTYLLRLHGGAAMVMLVLLGALLPLHMRIAWRRRRNRASGLVMVVANAVLVV